jgi:hypothetical protein
MRTAAMAGMMAFYWTFGLVAYAYMAFCVMTIAKKLGAKEPWMAWVPILNIYLMIVLAEKPVWWIILCFIPLVNIVILLMVWAKICEKRGRPAWWTVLFIIPIANLIVPALLAFTDSSAANQPPPPGNP